MNNSGRFAPLSNRSSFDMSAKIYRPAKTAMQSGKAKTNVWVLEFDAEVPRKIDPIMGYTSSSDMKQQLKLTFETQEQAEAYAQRKDIEYRVIQPKEATRKVVSYTDNFRFNRTQPWTH
ncbi:NADH-ubiquinone oxidoreductase [Agrobacterium sp. TS43]|nr:NADH-ubiquinone oxidoreductase [Agrobacterium sp. LY4]KVK43635.1 NADH-ubiquinone oxidoreductase [Agrobacterium sp. JL28]KVK57617.1 NADH-ubiquinone oxidoreductase [Agrobacterium sp. TS45]KVK58035.1 NADH-ubiquinone oxidoreductase [Agrobacterium sp. TS43]KVK61019.1 NADH-ubiquinone oxidoreductase [Agrobacterium sp. C13]